MIKKILLAAVATLVVTATSQAVTIDFDTTLPTTYSSNGSNPIVLPPSVDQRYTVPDGSTGKFFAAYNANNVYATTTASIGFGSGVYSSFSMLWGTVDHYNTLQFFLDGALVNTVTGTQAAGALVDKNATINYTTSGFNFNSISLTSDTNAFEIDNITITPSSTSVPDGGTTAALLGLAMMGIVAVRSKLSVA